MDYYEGEIPPPLKPTKDGDHESLYHPVAWARLNQKSTPISSKSPSETPFLQVINCSHKSHFNASIWHKIINEIHENDEISPEHASNITDLPKNIQKNIEKLKKREKENIKHDTGPLQDDHNVFSIHDTIELAINKLKDKYKSNHAQEFNEHKRQLEIILNKIRKDKSDLKIELNKWKKKSHEEKNKLNSEIKVLKDCED